MNVLCGEGSCYDLIEVRSFLFRRYKKWDGVDVVMLGMIMFCFCLTYVVIDAIHFYCVKVTRL